MNKRSFLFIFVSLVFWSVAIFLSSCLTSCYGYLKADKVEYYGNIKHPFINPVIPEQDESVE